MSNKYSDIIHLPHKQSSIRPHMPVIDRAAQFAPFAALTGYDSAIAETGRLTDERRELSNAQLEELNAKLCYIKERLDDEPPVMITYFREDDRKSGGAYLDCTGIVKKIDECEHAVVMQDGTKIFFEDIKNIDCPALSDDEH